MGLEGSSVEPSRNVKATKHTRKGFPLSFHGREGSGKASAAMFGSSQAVCVCVCFFFWLGVGAFQPPMSGNGNPDILS